MKFKHFLPLLIGVVLSLLLGGWWGFRIVFPWIGGWITIGNIVASRRKGKAKDLGRRIAILMIAPVFLIFLGAMQRENLQIEEVVFYAAFFVASGMFIRVLVHYAIAKVLGPLIWGRGFCGWACWTAALMEWLPIKENCHIPKKYTRIRYVVLVVSILVPLLFMALGYDWQQEHINTSGGTGKMGSLVWFIVGNALYYAAAVVLAFRFKKRRAFCKIACPVSLIMKAQTKIALVRISPSGKECTHCGTCNAACPMDVDVMRYISAGRKVGSGECILCGKCGAVCKQGAIK